MPLRWMMLIVLFLVGLAMRYQFQSVASVSTHLVADLGLSYTQVGTLIGFFLLPGIFIAWCYSRMTHGPLQPHAVCSPAAARIRNHDDVGVRSIQA